VAKYCPSKRRSRKSNKTNIEVTTANQSASKQLKDPWLGIQGDSKEIYNEIRKIAYITNGIANKIYKTVGCIYHLKLFSELNNNNPMIYRNNYATKVINEKIKKIAFEYDKLHKYDTTEYKSIQDVDMLNNEIKQEINDFRNKILLDSYKQINRMELKEKIVMAEITKEELIQQYIKRRQQDINELEQETFFKNLKIDFKQLKENKEKMKMIKTKQFKALPAPKKRT
jgi:hypothetical protein